MDKSFFDTLSAFNPDKYQAISNDELLAYSLNLLKQNAVPATFETLVVTTFKLFPESFSLIGFTEFPDAARINRSLLHSRPKYRNLMDGNAKNGFSLTTKGREAAEKTEKRLTGDSQSVEVPKKAKPRRIDDQTFTGSKVVEKIENSILFQHWSAGDMAKVGPYDIWSFLEALPYTEKSALKLIINSYREAAVMTGRKDILSFLDWVTKERYSHIFKQEKKKK
jgi:hypothetical protein